MQTSVQQSTPHPGLHVVGALTPRVVEKESDLIVGEWYWVRSKTNKHYPKSVHLAGEYQGEKFLAYGGMRHRMEHVLKDRDVVGPIRMPEGWE